MKVVRKETERIKNKIYNEAREIAQNASAKAVVIDAEAKAKALRVVEEARSEGLKNLYSELGITTDEEKAALTTYDHYGKTKTSNLTSATNLSLNSKIKTH